LCPCRTLPPDSFRRRLRHLRRLRAMSRIHRHRMPPHRAPEREPQATEATLARVSPLFVSFQSAPTGALSISFRPYASPGVRAVPAARSCSPLLQPSLKANQTCVVECLSPAIGPDHASEESLTRDDGPRISEAWSTGRGYTRGRRGGSLHAESWSNSCGRGLRRRLPDHGVIYTVRDCRPAGNCAEVADGHCDAWIRIIGAQLHD
jgi:hypothetical protein